MDQYEKEPDSGRRWPEGREIPREVTDTTTPKGDCPTSGAATVGFVYFIETSDGAFVKIGFSVSPSRRFADIRLLLPGLRLLGYMPGSMQTETWFHQKFASDHEHGEWFRSSPTLLAFIAALGLATLSDETSIPKAAGGESVNRSARTLTDLRNRKLSPERRRDIARNAVQARWAKVKAQQQNGTAPDPASLPKVQKPATTRRTKPL